MLRPIVRPLCGMILIIIAINFLEGYIACLMMN